MAKDAADGMLEANRADEPRLESTTAIRFRVWFIDDVASGSVPAVNVNERRAGRSPHRPRL